MSAWDSQTHSPGHKVGTGHWITHWKILSYEILEITLKCVATDHSHHMLWELGILKMK